MIPGAPVYWYDEIDSTSEEAKRRAATGQINPVWIAARQQSAGRGRLGRAWVSPTGNLYTTALFDEPGGFEVATRLPFAAGLGVVDACRAVLPEVPFALKWPNDVRVAGAKLCGILVESGQVQSTLWLAVGIGLNVAEAPGNTGQATTCLRDLGGHAGLDAENLLEELRATLPQRVRQAREDFEGLLADWQNQAEGLGEEMTAGPTEARVTGTFVSLAPDGGLVLRLQNGTTQTIRAGDVELVRRVP